MKSNKKINHKTTINLLPQKYKYKIKFRRTVYILSIAQVCIILIYISIWFFANRAFENASLVHQYVIELMQQNGETLSIGENLIFLEQRYIESIIATNYFGNNFGNEQSISKILGNLPNGVNVIELFLRNNVINIIVNIPEMSLLPIIVYNLQNLNFYNITIMGDYIPGNTSVFNINISL